MKDRQKIFPPLVQSDVLLRLSTLKKFENFESEVTNNVNLSPYLGQPPYLGQTRLQLFSVQIVVNFGANFTPLLSIYVLLFL